MSSTRRAPENAPLSQNRYMSSPEFAELRGISGTAVAAKAAILFSARQRSLLYFLQAMSIESGGLPGFVRQMLETFPERIGEGEGRQLYNIERCANIAQLELEKFIIDLCINPRLEFAAPGEPLRRSSRGEFVRRHPELKEYEFKEAAVPYFRDVIGALFEMQQRHITAARAGIAETSVSKRIDHLMCEALRQPDRIYTIEGREGIGKSHVARAWCQQHSGVARYVTLSGASSKTTVFRIIAKALGLGATYTRKAGAMQWHIEDVLQRSKLMLVIDEAAYLLPQGERCYSRPEMLDWLYTSLTNHRVPTVLLVTPIFARRVSNVEKQVAWNANQFRRRTNYEVLPELQRADLELVAGKLLPDCGKREIEQSVDYGFATNWPLTSIVTLIEDARSLAAASGEAISFKYLNRAIRECRVPSDVAQARAFERQPSKRSAAIPDLQPAFRAAANDVQDRNSEAPKASSRGNLMRVESPELLDA